MQSSHIQYGVETQDSKILVSDYSLFLMDDYQNTVLWLSICILWLTDNILGFLNVHLLQVVKLQREISVYHRVILACDLTSPFATMPFAFVF